MLNKRAQMSFKTFVAILNRPYENAYKGDTR